LGLNLRQLTRYLVGEVRPKKGKMELRPANEEHIDENLAMSCPVG
jgi:hypothetical protein